MRKPIPPKNRAVMGPESDDAVRHRLLLSEYLKQSRKLSVSLVLIAPVFLLYQMGIIIQLLRSKSGAFTLNGADAFTSNLLRLLHGSSALYIMVVSSFAFLFVWVVRRSDQRQHMRLVFFPPLLAESTLYALIFGATIHVMMGIPSLLGSMGVLSLSSPPFGLWMKIFHALGAGFNEEIIFRMAALGGMVYVGSWLKLPRGTLIVSAFILSSLAFSAFHYLGPYGDLFTFNSFMFRFLAGILLATVYWWRGLAVGVYTHAVYDLYFFLFL